MGPETAKAPLGWEDQLVVIEVPPRPASDVRAVAFCLEPHDLILSKLAANRERDWDFAKEALTAGLVRAEVLLERVDDLPIRAALLTSVSASLKALVARSPTPAERGRARGASGISTADILAARDADRRA